MGYDDAESFMIGKMSKKFALALWKHVEQEWIDGYELDNDFVRLRVRGLFPIQVKDLEDNLC